MKQSAVRWLLLAIGAVACGGPQKAGKSGAVCFRDDDCMLGLVCVAPEGSTERVCSDDVTGIISEVDAGVAPPTGGAPGSVAGSGNGGGSTSGGMTASGGMATAAAGASIAGAPSSGGTGG